MLLTFYILIHVIIFDETKYSLCNDIQILVLYFIFLTFHLHLSCQMNTVDFLLSVEANQGRECENKML